MSYSFNWPDIPFSGTEVDAFVVEYKALAEAIMEDYETFIRIDQTTGAQIGDFTPKFSLKLPFQEQENVRTFLEHGLLYAAFIVKQRAGNAGPGTDFNLENSPFPRPLPEGPTKRTTKDIGPSANEEALKRCFEDHQEGKRNSTGGSGGSGGAGGSGGNGGSGAGPGTGGPGSNPPPGDDPSDDPDDNNGPPPSKFPPGPNEVMGSQQNTENIAECGPAVAAMDAAAEKYPPLTSAECIEILLLDLFTDALSFLKIGNLRYTYMGKLTFEFVERYLKGTGGVFGLSDLTRVTSPLANIWIREDIMDSLNRQLPTVVQLTPAQRAGYGMEPSHNAYVFVSPDQGQGTFREQFAGFQNSLGDFTVITDGTETVLYTAVNPGGVMDYGGMTNISQILQVRDDYDFNDYGLVVDRALGGFAGDPISDDQIKTGDEWTDPETTPCDASVYEPEGSGQPKWNGLSPGQWIRYMIARNAREYTSPGQYVASLCKGRPFAVHLDWR
tara:strand:- start:590 stop:2083 length:1494 start_codon:yes stop_codon:yes gene_type:complete